MFTNSTRIAAAFCSLMLTIVAVGAAVDGHAATTAAGAVAYASADTGETGNG